MHAVLALALALSSLPLGQAGPAPTGPAPLAESNPVYVPAATITITCDEFTSTTRGTSTISLTREATLAVGDTLAITLCSNPGTGFSWEDPAYDHAVFTLLDHSTAAPRQALPGAAGTETWKLQVLKAGDQAITFRYSQPWVGGTKAAWAVSVTAHAATPVVADAQNVLVSCADLASTNPFLRVERVAVKVGETFSVALCANASTGFSWTRSSYGARALELLRHGTAATTALLGAPETETWTFRAVKPGVKHLVFWYVRPWEPGQRVAIVWLAVRASR